MELQKVYVQQQVSFAGVVLGLVRLMNCVLHMHTLRLILLCCIALEPLVFQMSFGLLFCAIAIQREARQIVILAIKPKSPQDQMSGVRQEPANTESLVIFLPAQGMALKATLVRRCGCPGSKASLGQLVVDFYLGLLKTVGH